MEDLQNKTTLSLAQRLNEIMVEQNNHELSLLMLDDEFNQIVQELCRRIPSLKNDIDLQPKKRVRKYEYKGCDTNE